MDEKYLINCLHNHFYFQFCIEGECVPYYPDDEDQINNNNDENNDVDTNHRPDDDDAVVFPGQTPENNGDHGGNKKNGEDEQIGRDKYASLVPLWYDPIFTQVFTDLREKYADF